MTFLIKIKLTNLNPVRVCRVELTLTLEGYWSIEEGSPVALNGIDGCLSDVWFCCSLQCLDVVDE